MVKILYHHRTQGGAVEGVHIRSIVEELRQLGNEVILISPPGVDPFAQRSGGGGGVKKTGIARILSILSWGLPQIFFESMEMLYSLYSYLRISRVISSEKIDLIYERYAFYNIGGALAARIFRVPLLLEVNEVSGLKRQRKEVLAVVAKYLEKKLFNTVQGIVVVSSYLKEHIAARGVPADRIRVIPNAVDLMKFKPGIGNPAIREKYGIDDDETVLGFVGTFSVWDNLEMLLAVFADILKENASSRLMLVGDGPDRSALETIAVQKGMEKKVLFTGRVPRQEVPGYINAMDICVMPDSNAFGSPVVLFEYMAMAKAIVAPRLKPIEDVLTDNVNGILFIPGYASALKEAILRLLCNKGERERLGQEAKRGVVERHTWKKNTENILAFFEDIRGGRI